MVSAESVAEMLTDAVFPSAPNPDVTLVVSFDREVAVVATSPIVVGEVAAVTPPSVVELKPPEVAGEAPATTEPPSVATA
jgi:hypothetical protein